MINWKEERATKNYCRYCTDGPTGSSCSGSCFDEKHTEKASANRVDHILTMSKKMSKKIPKDIKKLKKRLKEYQKSLSA